MEHREPSLSREPTILPMVSIICVTFNRRDLALRCLESCFRQDYPALEVIVLVNASNDGTDQAVRTKFPKARLICTHKNIGIFPALNVGIANATGYYVMNVDDDAHFIETNTITRLVRAFDQEPSLGAVACNQEGPAETPIAGADRYVDTFTAGFTLLPRKVFTDWVGYYPDIFFRDAGETYISMALWEQGKPIKKLCQARMYHERTMQGRSDWHWKFHGLRSQILVALMREPWYLLAPSLLSKFFKSLIQYIRWRYPLTWAHAWLSSLFHIPDALRHRFAISWRTERILWRLRTDVVTDLAKLR